jgi:hypothetical protein
MGGSGGFLVALFLLPTEYNPDASGRRRRIEAWKYVATMRELATRFGGGSLLRRGRGIRRGFWWDRGILYEDELLAVEVDIPDTRRARHWIRKYAREILLPRFAQKAIYVRLVGPVEVLLVTVS